MKQGIILKGIGSFYTVYSSLENKEYVLKLRGIFRKNDITPIVGDEVKFSASKANDGTIDEILPRKNELIRPPIANVDNIVIVAAASKPCINYVVLDKMIINAAVSGIEVVLCINKSDLVDDDAIEEISKAYKDTCKGIFVTSAVDDTGIDMLREYLKGKTTVFAGISGVGKSSLLNKLFKGYQLETGDLSEKINRGKHTTRHTELFVEENGTLVADTPGFSSLELMGIEKEDLAFYYDEFEPFSAKCKFHMCAHINEPKCAVKEAVESGKISKLRYDNYVHLYNELKKKEDKY